MRVRKACCDSRYSKRESAYCTITRAVYNTLQFLSVWFETAPPDAATPNLRSRADEGASFEFFRNEMHTASSGQPQSFTLPPRNGIW